jgi:ribonuclease J
MKRITEAARGAGYLQDLPPLLSEDDGGWLPPDRVLYLCTGSQGEPRAALSRIASGDHPRVVLESGDTVIFSSRVIPGNERAIFAVQNRLASRGIDVLTERDHFVHVSGHPCRDDLADMYRWVRPKIAIPVHGELRHLIEHEKFAQSMQVPQTVLTPNGTLVRLAPRGPEILEEVEHGRLVRDGKTLFTDNQGALKERRKLSYAGVITASLVVDQAGRLLAEPRVTTIGVPVPDPPAFMRDLSKLAADVVAREEGRRWADQDFLKEMTRRALRQAAVKATGVKPETRVEIIRV